MFVCNECLKERFTNGEGMFKSNGNCEICNERKVCSDIPSKYLELKKEEKTMDYAIIKAGNTGLLEVVKLTDWEDCKWDGFATVKSKENGRIEWFESEDDAVSFMLNKFPRTMINDKYFKELSNCGEYYID